ncbi:hypothetical protein HPP92_024277 [Vanilla planifolia]|uniref:RanBP2-type domain-containing protein n=1 Tax=Vanilla planifolia TaxID=51239 RepID=A0A835UB67_VANPL|nr:hypothetical protein HPP92_024277 [Vanilla planifolia]
MNRKAGDWNCRSCNHLNFGRRDSCQRCGDSRIGGEYGCGLFLPSDVKPGTGTALAACTTSPAAPAASSAAASRMPPRHMAPEPKSVATTLCFLGGNPATGFATGTDAMSTILPAESSASAAMRRGSIWVVEYEPKQSKAKLPLQSVSTLYTYSTVTLYFSS